MASPRKLPAAAALGFLLALLVALTLPLWTQGKILAPLDITTTMLAPWNAKAGGAKPHNHFTADAVTQYLPYRLFAEKSLTEDGYVGWNPYEMGGYSLAANTMATPGAWTVELHRVLPFKDAWNTGIVIEFLIAGAGMLVFLRSRKLPWLACLIGAVAYMLNSQFVIWIHHRWALGSFCWMPWVLWSALDGNSWKSPSLRQVAWPLFLALALLGGTLQHLAFVVLACGCLMAPGLVNNLRKPLAGLSIVLPWVVAFAAAIGITAFTLVPQIQGYLANNALGHSRGGIGYEFGPSQPFFQSLIIPAQVWPWLLGGPSTVDAFRGFKCNFMSMAYLGTIPMVLAMIGVFRKGLPAQAKWLVLVGLLIPLTPLVGPLYHRVQLLFLLGGAWLAAEMLVDLTRNPSWFIRKALPVGVAALGVMLTIAAVLPHGSRNAIEEKIVARSLAATESSSLAADREWIAGRAREWVRRVSILHPRTAWTYGLLVAGTLGLLAATGGKGGRSIRIGQSVVLGATILELGTFFHSWCTFSDPTLLHPPDPSIDRVGELAGDHRVLQASPGDDFTSTFAAPNLLAANFIPSIEGYESIHYRSILAASGSLPAQDRLTIAGVGVAAHKSDHAPAAGTESWPVSDQVSGYTIRSNPAVIPMVAAGTGPLPATPMAVLPAVQAATPMTAGLQTMNRIQLTAPEGSRWLRFAMNWHPGWQWRSSGASWQSFVQGPDSAAYLDLQNTAGLSIEARFFPRPSWVAWLSAIAAAGCLGLVIWRGISGLRVHPVATL